MFVLVFNFLAININLLCCFHSNPPTSIWRINILLLQRADKPGVKSTCPKGFLMFTHTVLYREVLEQDGCNLNLSGGALKPLRPANLCPAALHSARPWCVFFHSLALPWFPGLIESWLHTSVQWQRLSVSCQAFRRLQLNQQSMRRKRLTQKDTHAQHLSLFCIYIVEESNKKKYG